MDACELIFEVTALQKDAYELIFDRQKHLHRRLWVNVRANRALQHEWLWVNIQANRALQHGWLWVNILSNRAFTNFGSNIKLTFYNIPPSPVLQYFAISRTLSTSDKKILVEGYFGTGSAWERAPGNWSPSSWASWRHSKAEIRQVSANVLLT